MAVWVCQFDTYLVLIEVGETDEGVGGGGAVFLSLSLDSQGYDYVDGCFFVHPFVGWIFRVLLM